ncbi:MAG TPA: FAD-dependent oxidoreductase [Ktedonobacteraceae bacterium]|jgi:NADPH-dependent 2,4-dienoyl-CoA reductase/sulfur reductase-like enzyme|nr:FAD-dependent oxidoreductase [Ktedonobacteraceae bacterium]
MQISNAPLDSADIVIVGNGIAGLTAALEARALDPEKRIVIITSQIHPTINTPALKQFAIAKLSREQLLAYPAGTERERRIHVVNAHVEEIHARSKYVALRGSRGFGYGSLLIATGSQPQGISDQIPGHEFDGVLTLHCLQEYLDLRRRLSEVSEAVVIGGGVHAIETVMGLRHWGIRVHWLIRGSTFMRNVLDESASSIILEHVRRQGVVIHTETEIVGIVGRVGGVAGVITNQQQMLPCQIVLACTGTKPVTTLAEHCSVPIQQKNGIIVDDKLRSSVRDIYAAGDVAALLNPQTGCYETRAQWYAATFQGRIAGAMLVGDKELARQPFGVSWHATHLGVLSMLTVGEPLNQSNKIVTLTDTSQGGYRRLAIANDRLVGYLSLGHKQCDSLAIKRIIDEGHSIRGITKSLLKGNFDARRYLSQIRSKAAAGIISSGKLPPLASNQPSEIELRPVSGHLSHGSTRRDVQSQPGIIQEPAREVVYNEDDINPFTGNLPAFAQPITGEFAIDNSLIEDTGEQDSLDDMPSPFTGNLPSFDETDTDPTISYTEQDANRARNLWAYSDATPASQQKKPEEIAPARKQDMPSSTKRNLWSYTPRPDQRKKGGH